MRIKATLGIILLALLAMFGLAAGEATAALTDNLIGYWAFEGSGADGSGGGRDVSLYGSATYGTGLFGQALSLPGQTGSFAARQIDDEIYNFGSGDFTIQVWVKFNSTSGEQTIFEKFTGSNGPGWTLTKLQNGYPRFHAQDYITQDHSNNINTTGSWHHLLIRRQENSFSYFVDGKPIEAISADTITTTRKPLLFGHRDGTGGQDFPLNGLIDEAAIWSRALSDTEINYLYNSGAGNPVPIPSAWLLLGSGLLGLAGLGRRLRKS